MIQKSGKRTFRTISSKYSFDISNIHSFKIIGMATK